MFFQTTIVAALASLAVATPLALRTDSRCNTESVKCCNKSEDAETFKKSALAALIPIEIGDITGKVYSQCSPIVGLIGGSSWYVSLCVSDVKSVLTLFSAPRKPFAAITLNSVSNHSWASSLTFGGEFGTNSSAY